MTLLARVLLPLQVLVSYSCGSPFSFSGCPDPLLHAESAPGCKPGMMTAENNNHSISDTVQEGGGGGGGGAQAALDDADLPAAPVGETARLQQQRQQQQQQQSDGNDDCSPTSLQDPLSIITACCELLSPACPDEEQMKHLLQWFAAACTATALPDWPHGDTKCDFAAGPHTCPLNTSDAAYE